MFLPLFIFPRSQFCADQFTPGTLTYVATFHFPQEIYHYRLTQASAKLTSLKKHQAT